MSNLDFTKAELSAIHSAVDYLLGAELLEEDGWTDKDIDALNSVLKKVDDDIIKDVPTVCKKCPFVAVCDDMENCKHRKELEEKEE